MQTLQRNIVYATGRVHVDKDTPYYVSIPFSQIQYLPPDEGHENGSLYFALVEDGIEIGSMQMSVDKMDIRKYMYQEKLTVEMYMLNSGKNVLICFQ